MNSMTRTGRVLWLLFLAFCVGCSVWSVWQLFTDADRVVSAVVVGIVTVAVARPAVTNLVWAVSLLFWKPLKWVDSLYEWLLWVPKMWSCALTRHDALASWGPYVSHSVPVARVVGTLGCAFGTLEGP